MNRRHFLLGSLAGAPTVAGCLSLGGGGSDPGRQVSIASRDAPPDVPVRPSVEVVEAAPTDARPPRLRAAVENTGDHTIEVGEERAIVFAFVHSAAQPGLVLLPTAADYAAVERGCWRLAEPVAVAEYYGVNLLDPGESVGRDLGVWASHDADDCLPTGEYRFESRFAGARDRSDEIEDPEWEADWGFTLAVE